MISINNTEMHLKFSPHPRYVDIFFLFIKSHDVVFKKAPKHLDYYFTMLTWVLSEHCAPTTDVEDPEYVKLARAGGADTRLAEGILEICEGEVGIWIDNIVPLRLKLN